MTPTILQRVRFSASPETLFEMYMDSKKHAASTGGPAKMSRKVGETWSAAGGAVVEVVHVGVPQHDQKGVRNGWPKYYWKPRKKYLAGQTKRKK
jgi:hypothetical protein